MTNSRPYILYVFSFIDYVVMDELIFDIIEYTIPLEDAQSIIWAIQNDGGKDAALDWMHGHLARFN